LRCINAVAASLHSLEQQVAMERVMNLMEALRARRAIREFTTKPVGDDLVEKLGLPAGWHPLAPIILGHRRRLPPSTPREKPTILWCR
jgi:hypothetical protein